MQMMCKNLCFVIFSAIFLLFSLNFPFVDTLDFRDIL